jgi:glycosyltransferase involved in cell wall biosynthesis
MLKKYFSLEVHWIDSPESGGLDYSHFDDSFLFVLFFQKLAPAKDLQRVSCPQIVYVPMYDEARHLTHWQWFLLRKQKIISFSQTLQNKMDFVGLDSLCVQYYPQIPEYRHREARSQDKSAFDVLYWYRYEHQTNKRVPLSAVRKLVSGLPLKKLHVHFEGNLSESVLQDEFKDFPVSVSRWSDTSDEYHRLLERCDIFIAPREYEGIGMAFLEAMSMGKVVVAPDCPTMNEYIVDGDNGVLFDLDSPKQLVAEDLRGIGARARESCIRGRAEWLSQEGRIIEFLCEGERVKKKRSVLLYFLICFDLGKVIAVEAFAIAWRNARRLRKLMRHLIF